MKELVAFFDQNIIPLPVIKRIDGGEMRYYELPTGERYPSATSVLGAMSDHSFLDTWRERIGIEEATRQTNRAGRRGTAVHDMLERYVTNLPINLLKEMPFNVIMFNQIRKELDKNVNNIRVSEGMLYSHRLKIAGSVDLIAHWNGTLTVIDFKTSSKAKKKEWITNYFCQATMYAYMFWEMTGILIKDICIMICLEEEDIPQIFHDKTANWIEAVFTLCDEFHKK